MATILDLVQICLSEMDSDNVSSISDTPEAEQVALIIKSCFNDIVDIYDLTRSKSTFQLQALADVTKPTMFNIPSDVTSIEWVAYDIKTDVSHATEFTPIEYKTPAEFMDLLTKRSSIHVDTLVTTLSSGLQLNILKNKAPEFYTNFDDTQIIFDSYLVTLESTLQTSKTSCYGDKILALTIADATIIPLTPHLYQLLEKEAIMRCFDRWKEGASNIMQSDARRARVRAQRRKQKLKINQERDLFTGPNYGRRV